MTVRCDASFLRRLFGFDNFGIPRALAFAEVSDVTLEKEVEKRADEGNRAQPRQRLPAGRDRCLDDVGGQLKGETSHQPAAVAQPYLTALPTGVRSEQKTHRAHESFERSVDDGHERQAIDDGDGRLSQRNEPLSHCWSSTSPTAKRTAPGAIGG